MPAGGYGPDFLTYLFSSWFMEFQEFLIIDWLCERDRGYAGIQGNALSSLVGCLVDEWAKPFDRNRTGLTHWFSTKAHALLQQTY